VRKVFRRKVLAIRHGDREKSIGHLHVGLLRHAVALASRGIVAALTTAVDAVDI